MIRTAVVVALLSASCASPFRTAVQQQQLNAPPSASELESADFGPAPAGELDAAIAHTFGPVLLDPASALYSFGEPEHAWLPSYHFRARGAPMEPGHVYGWRVRFEVNARNAFGGYAGAQPYEAFFRGGELAAVLQQDPRPDVFGFTSWSAVAYATR